MLFYSDFISNEKPSKRVDAWDGTGSQVIDDDHSWVIDGGDAMPNTEMPDLTLPRQ